MSQMKFRNYLLIAITAFGVASAMGKYTVHELTGHVQLKQGAKTVDATPGMEVKPTDLIIIPEHATVKILDSRNSQIYESITSGQMSVTRIVFDASKKASNNSAQVHDKLRMGRSKNEGVVMIEKGKVTRALSTYDPAGEQLQLDVEQLSRRLFAMLNDTIAQAGTDDNDSPIVIRHLRNEQNGLSFMVENTMTFPIYFNVLKRIPNVNGIDISELGQPVGSYVLQPDQSIARAQSSGLDSESSHIIVVTNYYFDVDSLLTKLNGLINNGDTATTATPDFPLLIHKM